MATPFSHSISSAFDCGSMVIESRIEGPITAGPFAHCYIVVLCLYRLDPLHYFGKEFVAANCAFSIVT